VDAICKSIIIRTEFRKEDHEKTLITSWILLGGSLMSLFLNCWADYPTDPEYLASDIPCPHASSSFPNRLIFAWITPLIIKGFRSSLTTEKLWDLLPSLRSKAITKKFDQHYHANPKLARPAPRATDKPEMIPKSQPPAKKQLPGPATTKTVFISVFPALVKTFGPTFFFGSILKLAADMLSIFTPQIMKLMIEFAEERAADSPQRKEETWKGYFYGALLFSAITVQSLMVNKYFDQMFLLGLKVRTALISVVYRKALNISAAAKKDSTVGEIVNIMSVDIQKFMDLLPYVNALWSAPLQIALSAYWMYAELGVATFVGLGLLLGTMPINFYMARIMRDLQLSQMKLKDQRIKAMNEILSGIKVLKLYAWEPSFISQILDIRGKEVKLLKKSTYYQSVMALFWTVAPFVVGLGAFTYYIVADGNKLTASVAFVTLSYLNIMRIPLAMLPMIIVFLIQASVSMKRVNKFMNNEELDPDAVTHYSSPSAVTVENGTFTWASNESAVLNNINLTIPKGSLTAIVGTVGSGKSSLLSALLGDLHKIDGTVNTDGKLAYVPQQAWIQNSTLKGNITFCSTEEDEKYNKVVDACSLRTDFDILPAGDQTEIGEKGINLSGGQKQRVSLARAVYSDADIYLLDDPLSAVDSHVGKHIFEEVIGPTGLLKSKTRVLVTHGITYLPSTQWIVVVSNGTISEQGSYDELIARNGDFAKFMLEYMTEEGDSEFAAEVKEKLKEALGDEEVEKQLQTQRSRRSSKSSTSSHGSMGPADGKNLNSSNGLKMKSGSNKEGIKQAPNVAQAAGSNLIEKESIETGSVKFKVYADYMKAIGLKGIILAIIFQIVYTASSIMTNFWLTFWTDPRNPLGLTDNGYLGIYGGIGLVQAITTMALALVIGLSTLSGAKLLHKQMLIRIMMSPMSFFDTTPIGRIVNRFAKDVDVCDNTLPGNLRSWLSTFANFIATIISIVVVLPLFCVVIIPAALVFYVVQKLYVNTSRQLKRLESVTRSPIYSHFGETITGASCIRAFGRQQDFIEQSEAKVDLNQKSYYPSIIANRWLAVLLEAIGNFITFGAAMFAILQEDTITASEVGFVITNSLNVTQVLNWLVRMTSDVETNIVAVERIAEYQQVPQEGPWVDPEQRPQPEWPQKGNVEFKKFGLRYREGLDLVIKNISCSILGGEKIGIVGRTGAGKSSLTVALFRIVEAAEGLIDIDGVDISKIGLHDLRNKLTIIPQDPVLFSGSLRMNLDPFNKHSDQELWQVLELSNLKLFVNGLEKGLLHEISEGGENLSVGQRQLVCLARALLRKTKVLILDEATAAVDLETDDLIQSTIRTEFKDCTVLTIAHRLNTIMDYDQIMVLDRGELMEFNTPDALLADSQSIFYSLAQDAGLVDP
jgi:ATP-binding cassette subfamily C (CFTR/MRP) protein 1